MEENIFNCTVRCCNCGSVFNFSNVKVEKEKYKFEGKESMWLTHFDCPKCNERVFCQIDNEKTNSLVNDLVKILSRITRCKKNGRDIPKKLQSKYEKNSQELSRLRKEMMKKYNNQWFEDENGHTMKVRFKMI